MHRESEGPMIKAETAQETLTFESASTELISKGETLMRENSVKENRKYHTIEHPHTLERRAEEIAEIFGLSERKKTMVRSTITWHDTTIKFTPADPENIIATITRHRGAREGDDPAGAQGNEAVSARDMEREMRLINERVGSLIFSEEEIGTAMFMVEATYPEVKFGAPFKEYPYYTTIVEQNPGIHAVIEELEQEGINKGLLFSQPHLEKPLEEGNKIPAEAFVMVLDDLGGAGLAALEEFAIEGDKEFQELFVNISKPKNLKRLSEGDDERDETDRQKAAGAMMGWLKSQTGFVAWQMLRIEKIVFLLRQNGQIDTAQEERLHAVFNRFIPNIYATLARARNTEKDYNVLKEDAGSKAAFGYLARAMHYEL